MAARTPTWAAALIARMDALEGALVAPATSAPARGKAKSKVRTFATLAERQAGNGFACTAPEPCTRHDLRTLTRAAIHGVDEGGHAPR